MRMSLRRKVALRDDAAARARAARKAESLGRTTQVAHSTVVVGDGDVAVDELLAGSADLAVVVDEHADDLTLLDDAAGLDVDAWLDQQEQADADSDDAHAARMAGIEVLPEVESAQAAADQAAADALAAVSNAGGARLVAEGLYQVIPSEVEPTTGVGGVPLKQGDQWWVVGTGPNAGKFVGVKVYNGAAWQDRQLVADSVLVPSSVGNVLIADGAVNARTMSADFYYGREFHGGLFDGAVFSLSNQSVAPTVLHAVGASSTSATRAWTALASGSAVSYGTATTWVTRFSKTTNYGALGGTWNMAGRPAFGMGSIRIDMSVLTSVVVNDTSPLIVRVTAGGVEHEVFLRSLATPLTITADAVDLDAPIEVKFSLLGLGFLSGAWVDLTEFKITFTPDGGGELKIDRDPVSGLAQVLITAAGEVNSVRLNQDGVQTWDGTRWLKEVTQSGSYNFSSSVAAGANADSGTIAFPTEFVASAPVTLNWVGSTNGILAYVANQSAAGFVIRLRNVAASAITPGTVRWYAIGKVPA